MSEFIVVDKNLVMRYEKGSYTFSKVKPTAEAQKVFELANHLNSLQSELPKQIVLTETQLLI